MAFLLRVMAFSIEEVMALNCHAFMVVGSVEDVIFVDVYVELEDIVEKKCRSRSYIG